MVAELHKYKMTNYSCSFFSKRLYKTLKQLSLLFLLLYPESAPKQQHMPSIYSYGKVFFYLVQPLILQNVKSLDSIKIAEASYTVLQPAQLYKASRYGYRYVGMRAIRFSCVMQIYSQLYNNTMVPNQCFRRHKNALPKTQSFLLVPKYVRIKNMFFFSRNFELEAEFFPWLIAQLGDFFVEMKEKFKFQAFFAKLLHLDYYF